MSARRKKLTEGEWQRVFKIRCQSKTNGSISQDDLRLCERAMHADPIRYADVDVEVFNATVPFGSNAKKTR